MTIAPDTKDWTWVLTRTCSECGLATGEVAREELAGRVRDATVAWPAVLAGENARERPAPGTWSPLEYACHVRDAMRIFHGRVRRVLDESDPLFASWDQDETALTDRYAEQDPIGVGDQLQQQGEAFAVTLDGLAESDWSRPGRRSDGATFTTESLVQYALHDFVHHVWDVSGTGAQERH